MRPIGWFSSLLFLLLLPHGVWGEEGSLPRYRIVYLPADSDGWRAIVGAEDRGVFLRYGTFRALLEAAAKGPSPPPVAWPFEGVASASLRGVVEGERVRFTARLGVTYGRAGWGFLPIPDLPVIRARIAGGADLPLLRKGEGELGIFLEGPRRFLLELVFTLPVVREGLHGRFEMSLPDFPATSIELVIPGKVVVEARGIAAQRRLETDGEATRVLLVPHGTRLRVAWRPGGAGEMAHSPIWRATAWSTIRVGEALHTETRLAYRFYRGGLRTVTLRLPLDGVLEGVEHPDLAGWAWGADGMLRLSFHAPLGGEGEIRIRTVTPRASLPARIEIHGFEAPGAIATSGFVSLLPSPSVRIVPLVDDPDRWRIEPFLSGAPAWSLPAGETLALGLVPLPETSRIETRLVAAFRPAEISLSQFFESHGVHSPRFEFPFRLVGDLEIEGIEQIVPTQEGNQRIEALPWRRSGDQIYVEQAAGIEGDFLLEVTARLAGREELVPLPHLVPLWSDRITGKISIVGGEEVALEEVEVAGLEPLPPDAFSPFEPAETQRFLFGYRFHGPHFTARFRRREGTSHVTAEGVVFLTPRARHLEVHAALRYRVRGRPQARFTFSLPPGIGEQVSIEGEGIKEKVREPASSQGEERWRVTLQSGVREARFTLSFDLPTRGEAVAIPRIEPLGVERMVLFAAIEASDRMEIAIDAANAERWSHAQLPFLPPYTPDNRILGTYRFFRYPAPITLRWTRHEAEPVIDALIENLSLATAVSGDGRVRTEATFLLKNRALQFLPVALPEGSRLWAVRRNGVGVKPSWSQGRLLIPVEPSGPAGEEIALVYGSRHAPLGRWAFLSCQAPTFPAPVGTIEWHFDLDRPYLLLDLRGPLERSGRDRVITLADLGGLLLSPPSLFQLWPGFLLLPPLFGAGYLLRLIWRAWKHRRRPWRWILYAGIIGVALLGAGVLLLEVTSFRYAPMQGKAYRRLQPERNIIDETRNRDLQTYEEAEGLEAKPSSPPLESVPSTEALRRKRKEQRSAPPYEPRELAATKEEDAYGEERMQSLDEGAEALAGGEGGNVAMEKGKDLPAEADFFGERGVLSLPIELDRSGLHELVTLHGLQGGTSRPVTVSMRILDRRWLHSLQVICFATLLMVGVSMVRRFSAVFTMAILGILLFFLPRIVPVFGLLSPAGWVAFLVLLLHFGVRAVRRCPLVFSLLLLFLVPALAAAEGGEGEIPEEIETVYVPYREVPKKPLGAETQVYLPGEVFERLWEAAHPPEKKDGPRIGLLPLSADYRGEIEGERAIVRVRLVIETFTPGWHTFPLRYGAVFWREPILVDGEAATVSREGEMRHLHLSGVGIHEITFAFSVPVHGEGEEKEVAWDLPGIPASSLLFHFPAPRIEASIPQAPGGVFLEADAEETRLYAAIGDRSHVSIRWGEKASAAPEAALQIESVSTYHLSADGVELQARIEARIDFAPLEQIEVAIPPSLTMLSVEGTQIEGWEGVGGGVYRIRLLRPATGRVIFSAAFLGEGGRGKTRELPLLDFPGARRFEERLRLTTEADQHLDIVEVAGLQRAAHASVSGGQAPGLLFVRHSAASRLTYRLVELSPEIHARSRLGYEVTPFRTIFSAEITFEVKRRGVASLEVMLSSEARLLDLSAEGVVGWRIEPQGEESRLILFLDAPLLGSKRVVLRGEMRARLPGILRFPVIRPVADLEEGGTIEATLARHYALRETRREGLERRSDPSGPLQRYEITGEAWRLEWEVTRRKGEARAIVITRVTTGEDAFAVESVVLFEVTSGAIDHFLFHAASLPIEKITVNGERIRSWRPRKGETNLVELTLHAPVETRYTVSFSYLLEVPERGQEMEVPLLLPSGIDHVTGYLLVENGGFGETTIVRKEGFASERLALSDLPLLPAGVDPLDVVRVFKFFERPTIVLAVKPLRSLDLAKSVIDYVALESVVTAGGVALTRARFHLRNEREQFLGIELAEGEEIWSAKVADRPVKPLSDRTEQGRKRVLLPLVFPGAPGRTFDVEVIYRTPPPRAFSSFGRYRLEVPAVVNVPQVSKVLWTLHLPGAWHAFAFSGPFQAAGEVTLHTEELLSLVSEQKRLLYETESAQGGDRLEALRNLDELARRFTEVAGKRGRFEGAEISGGKEEVERGRLEQARRDFSRNLVRQRELTRQLAQQRASPLQGGPEVIEGWQLNAQLPEGRRFLIPQKQHSPSQLYGRRLPFPPPAKGAVRQGIESQKVEGIEPPRDVASPPPTRGGKVADAWREGGEGITHGGILPLDLSLPPGGGAFHFQKIGGGGAIEFRHLPRSWLSRGRSALDAILLVIVFLLLERHGVFRRYLPRWLARPAVHRLLFLVGLAGALFLSLSALLLWGPAWYGHGIWRRGKGGKG